MIHLPVTQKGLAKFLLTFNNAIYNFTYILTLSKGDKTTDYLANCPCRMEFFSN